MNDKLKAPFPYFGGKSKIAPKIWELLGDVGGYIEPFCGSAATLLARQPYTGKRVETLNDADGWLVNAWRAIKYAPEQVVEYSKWPVTEIDLHARTLWLKNHRDLVNILMVDPKGYDAESAAWWIYVMSTAIGAAFMDGSWHIRDGRIIETKASSKGIRRSKPALSNVGKGILKYSNPEHYLAKLSERLNNVRITHGDWQRVVTPAVLSTTASNPRVGVFLDPPYGGTADYDKDVNYGQEDCDSIFTEVVEWCRNADPELRIVLAGYKDTGAEILEKEGWTVHRWKSNGGYARSQTRGENNAIRETLWASPACLSDGTLF